MLKSQQRDNDLMYAIFGTTDIDVITKRERFLHRFGTRTRRRLERAGIYSNEDLINKTEAEIQTITHNKKCVNEIKEYLFAKGLCLLMPSAVISK